MFEETKKTANHTVVGFNVY